MISNLDTPVDSKKYDENFERIFGKRKRPEPDQGDTFVEGTADDKYAAGYDETFSKKEKK